MRKGRENPDARAMIRNTEKGQSEKADKENEHVMDRELKGAPRGDIDPTPPLPPGTCQASDLLSKQQTERDQGCKILAAAPKGWGGGQLKVQIMIQKIPDTYNRQSMYGAM
jgi:hypothetical protein